MKRFFSIALLLTALVSCSAPAEREAVSVIPQPQHLRVDEGHFAITRNVPIYLDEKTPEMERIAAFLNERLATAAGFTLKVEEADLRNTEKPGIWFMNAGQSSESYYLQVLPERILVEYGDGAGAFYALQTLLQLLPTEIFADHRVRGVRWEVPCCDIEDAPRFAYRGMHLDCCLHFFEMDFLKRYIDIMALHKVNRFHWHLTEDQGWRL